MENLHTDVRVEGLNLQDDLNHFPGSRFDKSFFLLFLISDNQQECTNSLH